MRTKRAVAALLTGGLVLLAGCSAGSAASSAASSAAAGASAGAGVGAAESGAGGSAAAGSVAAGHAAGAPTGTGGESVPYANTLPSANTAPSSPAAGGTTTAKIGPAASIIYTAQLTVRARQVKRAAATATGIALGSGGYVSQEETAAGPRATATVIIKIPVAGYAATLGKLSTDLGTQLKLTQQARDVTEQVADVNSQVASDQAAIAQLRALLAHAGSVAGLLSVQNQINAEESALEQMEAQQRALTSETSYATVTVTIYGPKAAPAAHKAKASPGLVGGAKAGWHALRVTVAWALAVLAAVAPFAAIAALAVFAGYRARRWLRRRTA